MGQGSAPATTTFRAVIEGSGKTAAGVEVPADSVEALGHGKRPPVAVRIKGHGFRSTVAVMGGRFMLGISAENRSGAGVAVGDEVAVELTLDTAPRVVTVPDDFRRALDDEPKAAAVFAELSYSQQRWHVLAIDGAKSPETRQRRITKSVSSLAAGRKQG